MDTSALITLLQYKLEYLGSATEALMLWWVSSVVFCGYIISSVWTRREDIKKQGWFHVFFLVISVFYSSIVYFGIKICEWMEMYKKSAIEILEKIPVESSNVSNGLSYDPFHEYDGVRLGVAIGTTSFVLVTIAWFALWIFLWRERRVE